MFKNMENSNNLYGNLFGTINILDENHLELILTSMDEGHAIYYLVEAIKAAHKRGSFTIGESEVLSKAIRVISKNSEE
jgi:hypothetical protein